MSVEIRNCEPERFAELLRAAEVGFAEDVADDVIERVKKVSDPARFLYGLDEDRIIATAGVFTMRLSVPGGELPAGGVTWVTVMPTHRRRGILRRMMRSMIDDCHARGEPLAMLWASQAQIYQRFGYGLATYCVNLEAELRSSAFTRDWPGEGRFRFIPAGEGRELVAPVYDAVRSRRAGFPARTADWWVGALPLADKDAKGGEAKRLVVFETDAGVEAYAVYGMKSEWDAGGSKGMVTVPEVMASTPRGERQIWRYLFDLDLMSRLKTWRLPPDHPILTLVAEPRRLGITVGDGLWLRIVDAKAALEGRNYGLDGSADGELIIELDDDYCPWNAGKWRMEVRSGRASVSRTEGEADVRLDANDLGAMFLGGNGPTALSVGGRVAELRPGGLARADRVFMTALAPWCPSEF